MKYLSLFQSALVDGLTCGGTQNAAGWWGRSFAGATFFLIGAWALNLDQWQMIGAWALISAANAWRD